MHRSVIPVAFGLCAVSLVQVQCVRVRPDQPMTEKEKIEAMLCYQNEHGVPLARLRPDQGSISIQQFVDFAMLVPKDGPPNYECIPIQQATLIALATAVSASSHLTASGKWLFTTHSLKVKEVLKDLRSAPVRLGDSILVSLSGGSLILEGRRVSITDYGHVQLEVGHQYVVYLKVIPETGDYTTGGPDESFEASDTGVPDCCSPKTSSCGNRVDEFRSLSVQLPGFAATFTEESIRDMAFLAPKDHKRHSCRYLHQLGIRHVYRLLLLFSEFGTVRRASAVYPPCTSNWCFGRF